jgi:hypothetical protein
MYVQGTKRMTQFSFYVECINKKELKKETTTSYPVDEQRTREQERGFGVGGEGRNSRRTVYSFLYIYIERSWTSSWKKKEEENKNTRMKEGMKHALGMLLHNWNCVPWTIYIYM